MSTVLQKKGTLTVPALMLLYPLQFGFVIHANKQVQKSDYINVKGAKTSKGSQKRRG